MEINRLLKMRINCILLILMLLFTMQATFASTITIHNRQLMSRRSQITKPESTNIQWYISNGKDVSGTTDGSCASETKTYQYTPYGQAVDYSDQQQLRINNEMLRFEDNPFQYSGYYQDFESEMYYLNARYYSPELTRFISRDSYDLANRYAYCDGDPMSNIDPTGHDAWKDIGFGLLGLSVVADLCTMGTTGFATGALVVGSTMSSIGGNIALKKSNGQSITGADYASIAFAGAGSIVGMGATNPELFSESWQGAALMGKSLKLNTAENGAMTIDSIIDENVYNTGKKMAGVTTNEQAVNAVVAIKKLQSRTNLSINAVSQMLGGIGNNIAHPNKNGLVSSIFLGGLVGAGTGTIYGSIGEATKTLSSLFSDGVFGKIGEISTSILGGAVRSGFGQFAKEVAFNGMQNVNWEGVGLAGGLGVLSYGNQIQINSNPLSKMGKSFFSVYRSKKDLLLNYFMYC